MPDFTITNISYQHLDFDRDNPRYIQRGLTTDLEILNRIIENAASQRKFESYANPEDSQLHPWIVIPSETTPERFTVIDGNIRLAAITASRNQEIRAAVADKNLPPFVDEDCTVTVALFADRRTAWLHALRHNGARAMSQLSHDQWAFLVETLTTLGVSYTEMAENSAIHAPTLAATHEARKAFEQVNEANDQRWSQLSSSVALNRAISHPSIREAIGLPPRPPNAPVDQPLPQDDEHQRVQRELMDWIYKQPYDDPQPRYNLEIGQNAELHRLYDDPELLEAFRQRGHRFYTIQSFIDSHEGNPSIRQAKDTVNNIKYHADQAFIEARHKFELTDAEYRLINIANVTYCIDQYGDSHYVVDLASRFPDKHRPIAEFLQQQLASIEPSCMVRFW